LNFIVVLILLLPNSMKTTLLDRTPGTNNDDFVDRGTPRE